MATFEQLPRFIVGMEACLSAHFLIRTLREMGFEHRIIPAIYVKPFNKGQKNDYNDAEAIAEAALPPNLKTVSEKTLDQLDLQALHRLRSRLVSRRTAAMNQIRAFLIEQGVTVRRNVAALRNSLEAILENRTGEMSLRTRRLIPGLQQDWIWLYKRIEMTTAEIKEVSETEPGCQRLMAIPGVGPLIFTATPNHVWSYGFVQGRTAGGRIYRILNIIDKNTGEALMIRVDRTLNYTDVLDALTDLFVLRGPSMGPSAKRPFLANGTFA